MSNRLLPTFLLLMSLGMFSTAVPGPANAAKMTLGAAALHNNSSLGGDVPPEHSYESASGFGGGVFFDYYLKDDVAIGVQPMFIQKGADLVWRRNNVEISRTELRMDYLSVPLVLRVTGNGSSRMYVVGGLQVDFLLDATRKYQGEEKEFDDGFEDIELATCFGVGGLLSVGSNYILIEGRYTQGFSNISKEQITTAGETTSIKTTGIQLIVGFLFGIGGGER